MAKGDGPVDISAELAALKHERQNQKMKRLPQNMTVQRRPLHHAPVASAVAGSHIPKVVYVSSHTPVMAAVKRVRKFLSEIENRATQSAKARGPRSAKAMEELVEATDRLAKANEEVLVKASGRAMQQALRVGEWFRNKEKEMVCNVEVRTGSVQAVDDIVEAQGAGPDDDDDDVENDAKDDPSGTSTVLEGGDTTMELLGDIAKSGEEQPAHDNADNKENLEKTTTQEVNSRRKKKRARRKRAVYDEDDVPEARIRWIKTVEVAISLKT